MSASIRDARREAAIERMADHVLAAGLAGATLRPLAAAAGTSDRMLLYYFADKDELLTLVLERVAARLLRQLDQAIPPGSPQPSGVLLERVWALLSADDLQPYMRVWLDLMAGAARGLEPQRQIAGNIADGYHAWVTSRLRRAPGDSPLASAACFLAIVEGAYVLRALGRPTMAEDAMGTFASYLKARGANQ